MEGTVIPAVGDLENLNVAFSIEAFLNSSFFNLIQSSNSSNGKR